MEDLPCKWKGWPDLTDAQGTAGGEPGQMGCTDGTRCALAPAVVSNTWRSCWLDSDHASNITARMYLFLTHICFLVLFVFVRVFKVFFNGPCSECWALNLLCSSLVCLLFAAPVIPLRRSLTSTLPSFHAHSLGKVKVSNLITGLKILCSPFQKIFPPFLMSMSSQ